MNIFNVYFMSHSTKQYIIYYFFVVSVSGDMNYITYLNNYVTRCDSLTVTLIFN